MSVQHEENKVVVEILGETYPVTSDVDPAHIERVAKMVDQRMQEMAFSSRSKARDRIAILTALSFASELLDKSGNLDQIEQVSADRLDSMLTRLEDALGGNAH